MLLFIMLLSLFSFLLMPHIALEQRAEKIKQDISEEVLNTIYDAKMKDVIILGCSEIYNNNKEHSGGYGYVGKIYSTIM